MPVSKEFFSVFGARAAYGDTFSEVHDRTAGGLDAIVLSYGLWTRLFGGNPSAVGSTVSMGDRAYTVIGVLPREFRTIPPADLHRTRASEHDGCWSWVQLLRRRPSQRRSQPGTSECRSLHAARVVSRRASGGHDQDRIRGGVRAIPEQHGRVRTPGTAPDARGRRHAAADCMRKYGQSPACSSVCPLQGNGGSRRARRGTWAPRSTAAHRIGPALSRRRNAWSSVRVLDGSRSADDDPDVLHRLPGRSASISRC